MIDIRLVRDDLGALKAALGRRGVDPADVDRVAELDAAHRERLARREALRAEVKALSRRVADARRAGRDDEARDLTETSRRLGEEERVAGADAEAAAHALTSALLVLPNFPADDAPDGAGPEDNVVLRTWWPGQDAGAPPPVPADHQRVPHWEIGEQLGILDLARGARLAGSMFPLYRGAGARLLRALTCFALDRHAGTYEEIRPPTLVLTDTMTSTGHLPKFADEAYHVERDDLWAIPTAEVPLTSMHRGEILDESDLPVRLTAVTQCFRREAGAAGRDTRGLLRVHEFEKVELFAYATPEQAPAAHADIVERAEGLLQALGLHYRVLDLCTGDLGTSSARTFDLEVYAPGCDRWLEVSSVSWFRDYQARRAQVRYRPSEGGSPRLVHTVNGSALAWARIWAALVETGRRPDGSVALPECLAPWMGAVVIS
ncbi:MAG: serine--tRNA ligase [Actinomycetota bacterium]|jgi:seryl-tRNA synthetase|nr:serine--tRNA ligase [Actinomycetota bacterium]